MSKNYKVFANGYKLADIGPGEFTIDGSPFESPCRTPLRLMNSSTRGSGYDLRKWLPRSVSRSRRPLQEGCMVTRRRAKSRHLRAAILLSGVARLPDLSRISCCATGENKSRSQKRRSRTSPFSFERITDARCFDVRFTPKSGHVQRNSACPLSANSGHRVCPRRVQLFHVSDQGMRAHGGVFLDLLI